MPTKKRRVGFIPREIVLEIINKLSFESNLSQSKVINILVEEALHSRGILDLSMINLDKYRGENISNNNENNIESNSKVELLKLGAIKNKLKKAKSSRFNEFKNEFIDSEIYEKFLMFLQFQEKMKKNNF